VAFPRRCLVFSSATLAESTKHFAAVTCAVSIPPYSRASATAFLGCLSIQAEGMNKRNPIEVARLPEHEVRCDCQGPKPTRDYGVPPNLRRRG
jgi:hypothetical protein